MGKKPKRPKKKIILVIVEGRSDINALEVQLGDFFEQIDENIEMHFCLLKDGRGNHGGDITSTFYARPENIEEKICKNIVEPYLRDIAVGIYPKDIYRIIQVVDTDGTFVPDERVVRGDVSGVVYTEENMVTAHVETIQNRNFRKKMNLNKMVSMDTIKIGTKSIPYYVYYMSCNLEHFISDNQNWETGKKANAREFATFNNTAELLREFIREHETETDGMTYEDSWDYIRRGTNSLKRHTNINVLMDTFAESM